MHFHPIGIYHSSQTEKYMAAKQAVLGCQTAIIQLNPGLEQAIEDLEGFERIWLIYHFNRNFHWKPKVQTPRAGKKRGVLATRSPHRPNPIGLSSVPLLKIDGLILHIGKNDLLDKTPIIDIKPYLPYADAFPHSKGGWCETNEEPYTLHWSPLAKEQALFISTQFDIITAIETRLSLNPYPFPNHRIKKIEDYYQLACKTWRIHYRIEVQEVYIDKIVSGYLPSTTESKWGDLSFHSLFQEKFPLLL